MLKSLLIGLRKRVRGAGPEDSLDGLRARYSAFRRLVSANSNGLESIADMQAKASGEFLFDQRYAQEICRKALDQGRQAVGALAELTGTPQEKLDEMLGRIGADVEGALAVRAPRAEGPAVLDLAALQRAPDDLVGAKTFRLAEILGHLRLPVPDGFAVTGPACRGFLEKNRLLDGITRVIQGLSLTDKQGLRAASEEARALVAAGTWPDESAEAILGAFDDLAARAGVRDLRVSVRSSAIGEDGEFSFAGQYGTVLNIGREGLLSACTEVLASQFGPRAIVYYKAKGLTDSLGPMSIGVFEMVDARVGGVLYTRDPRQPDREVSLVSGAWGLGTTTVDGTASPDLFTVGRGQKSEILESRISPKNTMVLCDEGPGTVEVGVPAWMRGEPCLTKTQLALLVSYGLKLEEYYGVPQDVEWVLDSRERVILLQSRPLRLSAPAQEKPEVVAVRRGLVPLLREGIVASRGCAAGEVYLLAGESRLAEVPGGAVLVARNASPLLAECVDKVCAIVTDVGSASSHLATIAREFRIPALFNTQNATAMLTPGTTVTVDGDMGNVFPGRVEALLAPSREAHRGDLLATPLLKRFALVLSHIAPLNLTDPRSRDFRPSGCKTLHDVFRYCHESAVREMFLAGSRLSRGTRGALKLVSPLPLDFYFIDLGGGLESDEGASSVRPEQFRCKPLLPLWEGMVRVPWSTAAAAPAGSFASLMSTAMVSGEASRRMAEPNFVIVSSSYINMSCRLGYHFSRLDASLSDNPDENYASFLFHGGAADAGGKARRVQFLARVLDSLRFAVTTRGDALFARTERNAREELSQMLEAVGRLLVITRQVDTQMGDDPSVDGAVDAFLRGDFSLGLAASPGGDHP